MFNPSIQVKAPDIPPTTKSGKTSDPLRPVMGTKRSCRHCANATAGGMGNKEREKQRKTSSCELASGFMILCQRRVQKRRGKKVHRKGTKEELSPRYVVSINKGNQSRWEEREKT